ncbi:MAG: hypothetical protein M3315_13235 [Actinomycetota bacterium]|nr:hypothetical protein [Actinomycetota bacterium]
MNDSEGYSAAVARCEADAINHGHVLGVWYAVDARLHASLCAVCGAMAWVTLPGGEKRWRVGGTAREIDCLEEDRISGSSA